MRPYLAALCLACGGLDMPQQVAIQAKGLFAQGNDLDLPQGALAQADNVVITRDGVIETRRGMAVTSVRQFVKLYPFKGVFLGHDGVSVLSASDAGAANWTDYSSSLAPPSGNRVRFATSNGNAYFTTAAGPYRLDSLTGTPERHGMPDGLDCQATLLGAGSALITASAAAYRVLFGKIDANGNTILGAPGGRGIVTNATGSTQDVTVTFSLPQGLPSGAFFQVYRTPASASATTDPGDEEGLIYQGTPPQAMALTQLSRTSSTVTATTASANSYVAGMIVRLPSTVQVAGTIVAVGASTVAATSPDGITWTSQTIAAGTYAAVAWNGTVFAAVGTNVVATSPDGVTWTARTIPAGSWHGIAWSGTVFAAVGTNVAATSPDGITWTSRTIPTGVVYNSVVWTGAIFVAIGSTGIATSPDGISWTARTIGTSNFLYDVAWSGSLLVVTGSGVTATSTDGIGWNVSTSVLGYPSVAFGAGVFVAVSSGGGGFGPRIQFAADGVAWNTVNTGVAYQRVFWNGTEFIAVGNGVAATSPDGITWTSRTIPAGSYAGLAMSGAQFPAGEKTLATASGSSFTYTESGGAGTVATTQTVTPLTGALTDSVPSAFIGATIYTAPSQNGIAGSAAQILGARDIAVFRETAFFANITYPSSTELYLLAVGGTSGVQAGDSITIDGLTYTANGSTESISNRTFVVSTSGSAAQNIYNTAASLIRIINRTSGNTVTVKDISDPNGVPGHLFIQESNPTTTCTVTFSGHATSWALANQKGPTQQKNELRWSQLQQPDVVPALNRKLLGSADKAILRVVPTRSAIFVLKEDGIWIVSGYSSPWQIDPFDPTIEILAPETAVVLDNQVYCLSRHGIMRISDTGVSLVSRPIENLINALLAPSMRATTASMSFAVADEHDHKYYLWLPTASTDTQGTQAFTFDIYTDAFTRRTDAAAHGVTNPADDRIYLTTLSPYASSGVKQERRDFAYTDLADQSYAVTINSGGGTASLVLADATNVAVGDAIAQSSTVYGLVIGKSGNTVTLDRTPILTNGAATSYRAIATGVQWTPKLGAGAGGVNQFSEVTLIFRNVYFAKALLGFSTSFNESFSTLSLAGTNYGWTGAPVPQFSLRSLVDLEHARAPQLNVSWSEAQAWSPAEIQALSVKFNPISMRLGR